MSEYRLRDTDPGRTKLTSSGIHPAVAASRGYTAARTEDDVRGAIAATGYQIGSNRWRGLRKGREAARNGGMMVMPWFTPGDAVHPAAVQFRPTEPVVAADGRSAKYVWPPEQRPVLDVHPAIPRPWLGDASVRLVVTEGLLKGDALVSAMVRTTGTDLGADATVEQVTEVLEQVRGELRCVPVVIGGVTQWRNVPGWETLPRADRDVYVAFDADVRKNPSVWRQASALFDMIQGAHGTPRLIDLTRVGASGKDGVDDHLSACTTPEAAAEALADLVSDAAVCELPPAPQGADREADEPYVNDDETKCLVDRLDSSGRSHTKLVAAFGGVIEAFEQPYTPTAQQIENGMVTDEDISDRVDEGVVRLSVAWEDLGGNVVRHPVTVPRAVLSMSTPDLSKKGLGVHAPKALQAHRDWPPTPLWWRAVKGHTAERHGVPPTRLVAECYGWVPGTSGTPVFALGRDVIGSNDGVQIATGMERNASSLDKFGLKDPGTRWREVGAEVLPQMVEAMVSWGAWKNPALGLLTLSASLRPVVPIRPKTVLYLYGPPASGKTWTATKAMKFWASSPRQFSSRDSGGTAMDTAASTETSVSLLPIWLADDLAPDVSRRQAESRESAIEQLVRSIANGQSKGRMHRDMSAQERRTPRAMTMITGENPLSTQSVKSRTISIEFVKDQMLGNGPKEALDVLFDTTDLPARLTGAVLRWVVDHAAAGPDGWSGYVAACHAWENQVGELARAHLEGKVDSGTRTRASENASDVLSTVLLLRQAATDIGVAGDERLAPLFDDALLASATELALKAVTDDQGETQSRRFLDALASLMGAGQAYVCAADGTQPDTREEGRANCLAMGWRPGAGGALEARGVCIGRFKPDGEGTDGVVVLSKSAAFKAVQSRYPEVLGYGTKMKQVWANLVNDGLREPVGSPQGQTWVVRVGDTSVRGVPVRLSSLLSEIGVHEGDEDLG